MHAKKRTVVVTLITCIILFLGTGHLSPSSSAAIKNAVPTGSPENNPWVFRVPRAFDLIPVHQDTTLNVNTSNIIHHGHYIRTPDNASQGMSDAQNQFASIKRLPSHLGLGSYIIIAGSNPQEKQAQLFVIKLASQANTIRFKKLSKKDTSNSQDSFIKEIAISKEFWNAGGIDISGKYLAIALSDDSRDTSIIVFYDMSYPEQPVRLTCNHKKCRNQKKSCLDIECDSKAHAVALTKLRDGRFLMAVYTDGSNKNQRGLDFYISQTCDLSNGFDHNFVTIAENTFENFKLKRVFHNINFVNDFDGSLYLIGTGNTNPQTPLMSGMDFLDLFEVKLFSLTQDIVARTQKKHPFVSMDYVKDSPIIPKVIFINEKQMFCKWDRCNFNAGATPFVPDEQHIYIYSIPHWLGHHGKNLSVVQYSSLYKTYP